MGNRELNILRFDEEDFILKVLEYNSALDRGGEYILEDVVSLAGDYVPDYNGDIVTNALHLVVRYNEMVVISVSYILKKTDYDLREHSRIMSLCIRRIIMIVSARGLPYIKVTVANNPNTTPYDFIREEDDKGFLPPN